MVNARIVVTPLFQMTFQFPKPFFGGLFVGADAFDSESLAVRNTFDLSPQSCHPKHCTKSIPYSQALRIKRICSNEQTTKKRLGELKCHLKKRGYNG
jgi:hypothetical protein